MDDPQVKVIAERLNAVSGQLNKYIKEEEDQISMLNLGIESWVTIGEKNQYSLGYTRRSTGWGIYIKQTLDNNVVVEWRLNSAPRGVRLFAIKHIPQLHESLIRSAVALTGRIEKFLSGDNSVAPTSGENDALDAGPQEQGEEGKGNQAPGSGVEGKGAAEEVPRRGVEEKGAIETSVPRRRGRT